jgi:hypothetical protein
MEVELLRRSYEYEFTTPVSLYSRTAVVLPDMVDQPHDSVSYVVCSSHVAFS